MSGHEARGSEEHREKNRDEVLLLCTHAPQAGRGEKLGLQEGSARRVRVTACAKMPGRFVGGVYTGVHIQACASARAKKAQSDEGASHAFIRRFVGRKPRSEIRRAAKEPKQDRREEKEDKKRQKRGNEFRRHGATPATDGRINKPAWKKPVSSSCVRSGGAAFRDGRRGRGGGYTKA